MPTDPYEELARSVLGVPPPPPKRSRSRLPDLISFAEENKLAVGSTTGGRHNRGSKHYSGNAIDIKGSGAFDDTTVETLKQKALKRGFLVRDERRRPPRQKVWGGPHVHIEVADSLQSLAPQQKDDPYRQLAEEVLSPSQPDDEYTKLARSVIEPEAPDEVPQRTGRFGTPRAPIKQQRVKRDPFAGVRAGAQGEIEQPLGVGELLRLDNPEMARRKRIEAEVKNYVPRVLETKNPDDIVLERIAAERAQEDEAVRLDEWHRKNQPGIEEQTTLYRQDIQKAKASGGDANKWLAEMGTKGGAGLTEMVSGIVKPVTPELANKLRIHVEAANRAAQEEGADRHAASRFIQDVTAGFIGTAPELAAMSAGIPAIPAFGAGSGVRAYGGDRNVPEAVGHGGLTGAAFELPVAGPLKRAGTVGAATTGIELASGAEPREALKTGLTNAAIVGVPGILRGGRRARQIEQESSAAGRPVDQERGIAQEPILSSQANAPQRFYHTQYGNVVKAADQTGARKGKTKIYVEGNPEEIHYPKTVDLRGRGNERMVPLKESASQPVEVLPEKPQQPPEAEGARQSQTPFTPERVADLDRLVEQARIKMGDRVPVPKLPTEEQQYLVSKGIGFDVNRMGEPHIFETQRSRVERKRQQISERQGLTEPSANVQWMPSKETGLPESGRMEGQAARTLGLDITENPYRRVDPKDVERFKPLAEEWEAGWKTPAEPETLRVEPEAAARMFHVSDKVGELRRGRDVLTGEADGSVYLSTSREPLGAKEGVVNEVDASRLKIVDSLSPDVRAQIDAELGKAGLKPSDTIKAGHPDFDQKTWAEYVKTYANRHGFDAIQWGKNDVQVFADSVAKLGTAPKPETTSVEPVSPSVREREGLTSQVAALVDERGNLTRGGDHVKALMKDRPDAEIKDLLQWTRAQNEHVQRFVGANVIAELRSRGIDAKDIPMPSPQGEVVKPTSVEQGAEPKTIKGDEAQTPRDVPIESERQVRGWHFTEPEQAKQILRQGRFSPKSFKLPEYPDPANGVWIGTRDPSDIMKTPRAAERGLSVTANLRPRKFETPEELYAFVDPIVGRDLGNVHVGELSLKDPLLKAANRQKVSDELLKQGYNAIEIGEGFKGISPHRPGDFLVLDPFLIKDITPLKEVIPSEATEPVTRPESTIVEEGAGLGALERGTEPAPSKRRTKPHDTLVTGERSDISLSQFVRRRGGIVPHDMFAGEMDRLRSPNTGTTGLINQRNVRGGRPMTADYMMEAANEAGFKDPQTGEKFDNVGNFLYAVERDVSTKNIKALTGTEVDFETEYRKHVDAQMVEAKDRDNAIKSADALVSLLEGGRGGELFDKIAANNATPAEQAELRSLARKRFVRTAELEDVIAEAKAEGVSTSFEGERAANPSRTERAEQLGFVQEGLTQESASLPPKEVDQRARLVQEEKQRQRERNPERAAALDTLAMLREKGMTVDEYARQGSLIGETPSRRKLALLRELESGNFGPGAASAKEPFPEVKERKFGKRFVEDERIAQEIRDSIGTAKYYEPIPNKVTAADAKKLVDERGVGQSINAIKDEGNNIPFHVRVAMGEIVALRTNKAYKNLKESNPKEAEFVLDQANETAEYLMDLGTRLGQGVQAYKMWSQQTPEGILLTYQKGVAKARQRTAKIVGEDVKEIVDTVNKEMSHEERVKELKKLFATNKTARKVRSQMDQLLKAAKDKKLEDKDFYDIVGDRLGLPKYDPKVASRIMSLAEQIADAPEGLPRDRKILQLNKYLAEQKGFDVGDLPIGIYYGNILSGYNTQIVNSVDTALNVISEINGLAMNNPRAAAKIYGGLLRGFSEGKLDAILTLTEGRMVTDGKWLEVPRLMEIAEFGKKGGVPISTATRRGRAMKSIAESKAGYPLNAYKYVTRMLAASDAVMFRSAKEARAALLAHRMAEAEGLTGDALDAKVRSILALDRKADFEKQAEREGFTGTAAKVRTAELIDMARNKEVSSDAADFAGEATYNHKPHGALGYASDVVGKWAEQYKALKLFVPFTRIVANVTNRGLNWTPYGFKRAAFGYSHGEALTPEGRRLMITRATLGTVGLVTLGAMQEAGLLQIHGAGPSDREKKRQLQNAGWRPYSIQIGSTYVSYVYSPTGLGLSIVGNMTDSQRYHELEQKDAATRGAYAIARLGSTVFSQSFLSGLSRLFNALSESPSESVSAVKQTMSSTVAAATTPNLARDIYRLFDNKAYQSNTLMEDLVRNTPFAALALKPQLNAFGEPVRVQRQRFFDVQTSDPAWQFVIQKGLKVPVPGRTLEIGKDERITPEQYYELLATTGPRVKQWVIANRTRLSRMKEDDAQDELQQAATRIRKFELSRMRLLARRKKAA